MGRFDDRLTHRLPTTRDIWRIMRTGGFTPKRSPLAGAQVPRDPDPRLPGLEPGAASLTWIGHATFVVQLGGLRIATDPIWRPALPGGYARITEPGLPLQSVLPLDAVTVSHDHYDHMDSWTFKRIGRQTAVFCPLGLGKWFRRRGFLTVHEMDWWQKVEHRGVGFTLVPSHHWGRRLLWDQNDHLWGGWMMEADGHRLHHAGDTAYGDHFAAIRARIGTPDVTMMPIGAYNPRWFMKSMHLDPGEAVQAASDLGARHMATMHWGTYPLTREPILEPLERVRTSWGAAARNPGDLWDVALGETRILAAKK